jgi:hypothetical protein
MKSSNDPNQIPGVIFRREESVNSAEFGAGNRIKSGNAVSQSRTSLRTGANIS